MLIRFDVLGCSKQHESWMLTASLAGRKFLPKYACHFVFGSVLLVVHYFVNSRAWNIFTWFKLITYGCSH